MDLVDNINYALNLLGNSHDIIIWDAFHMSPNNLPKQTIPQNLLICSKRECERLKKLIAKHQNDREFREAIYTFADLEYEDLPHMKWSKWKLEHIWTPISKGEFMDAVKFYDMKPLIEAWQKECEETDAVPRYKCIDEANSMIAIFIKHSEYKGICCFEGCNNKYGRFGNNTLPFRFPEGSRCCDKCDECVVARRMAINSGIKTPQGLYLKLFQGFSSVCEKLDEQKQFVEYAEKSLKESNEEINATNEKIKEANEKIKDGEKYKKLYEKEQRENKKLLKKQNKMLEDAMKNERAEFKKMKCDMERKIADLRKKLKNKRR
tara:strand:- start:6105 stop:7064 length:960 start_codon:yes stop_codon:yes gene_type:complete